MTHICDQESSIERVEKKVDSIDAKLDKYLEKTTVLETKMGFVTTGVLVVVVPLLLAIIKFYFIKYINNISNSKYNTSKFISFTYYLYKFNNR